MIEFITNSKYLDRLKDLEIILKVTTKRVKG